MCPGVNPVSSKVIPTVLGAIPTNPGFRGWDLGGAWIANLTYTHMYAHWYEPSYVIREKPNRNLPELTSLWFPSLCWLLEGSQKFPPTDH